jgi:hypothetical protein
MLDLIIYPLPSIAWLWRDLIKRVEFSTLTETPNAAGVIAIVWPRLYLNNKFISWIW